MSSVRSEKQLHLLLKYVDANNLESKRQNVQKRQKIWTAIAECLNQINGAKKDPEGWKRCFFAWRSTTGKNYKTVMQRLIQRVPEDVNYIISVDDDDEIEHTKNHLLTDYEMTDPSVKQKQLLHELVLKHRELLLSTADDEPLKQCLWQNITEELNEVPGALQLPPNEWEKLVDWNKYKKKKGRKSINLNNSNLKTDSDYEKNSTCDETTQASTSHESLQKSHYNLKHTQSPDTSDSLNEIDLLLEECDTENITEIDSEDLEDDDGDNGDDEEFLNYTPLEKRLKPTPLVKNFKNSNRVVKAVEQLRVDVNDIGKVLKQTTETLNLIHNTLEKQSCQQNEFNALLKRNTQLLKVLVEFKIGKRTNVNKRSVQINTEME